MRTGLGLYVHRAPVASWVPTDVTGLKAWWDASNAGSIASSGGKVSQWNDLSGVGNHLTQGIGVNQPTTATRTINSLNVLDFTGSPVVMLLSSNIMGSAAAGTALYVFAIDTDPPGGDSTAGCVLGAFGSAANGDHEPYSDGNVYAGFGSTARKTVGNPTPALTTPRQVDQISASGAWSYNIDGTAIHSTGTNTVGWNTGTNQQVGKNPISGDFYLDGRLAEILIYDTALSGTNLTNARSYLKTKWGTA